MIFHRNIIQKKERKKRNEMKKHPHCYKSLLSITIRHHLILFQVKAAKHLSSLLKENGASLDLPSAGDDPDVHSCQG